MIYNGAFSSKEDICKEFAISDFDGEVIYAHYEQDSYDGYANVVFMSGSQFYYSEGSHCSCYGLEDQWSPEEITIESILHMARHGTGFWNQNSGFAELLGRIDTQKLASTPLEWAETVKRMW